MEDPIFAAKYPFSNSAKEFLKNSGAEVNERIVGMSMERVKAALKGIARKSSAMRLPEFVEETASYAGARMLLSCLKNSFITNKFAVAESKRAFAYLNSESEENVFTLLEEFNFKFKRSPQDLFLVHFSTYLKNTPGSIDYRLINRNIRDGYVEVNHHELLRLLQEAIREKIQSLPYLKVTSPQIQEAAKSLLSELPTISPQSFSFKKGENPPCVEELLIQLKKHLNLSHQARWFLAVYLINRRMDSEKILELFSNFPDFKEKISRYQIEHAKKQAYVTPACGTVRGYGLCVANCRIGNPLNWRSKFPQKKVEEKPKPNGEPNK